jgi:Leucine Rich repeats (2 copies)
MHCRAIAHLWHPRLQRINRQKVTESIKVVYNTKKMIETLTSEQEALIPVYREKWSQIVFSTEPIDRQKTTEAVKAAYTALGIKEPQFLFCHSLFAALEVIVQKQYPSVSGLIDSRMVSLVEGILILEHSEIISSASNLQRKLSELMSRAKVKCPNSLIELLSPLESQLESQLGQSLRNQLRYRQLTSQLEIQLKNQVQKELESQLQNRLESQVTSWRNWGNMCPQDTREAVLNELKHSLAYELEIQLNRSLTIQSFSSYVDFCISVLNCTCDLQTWSILQSIAQHCGFTFLFKEIAIVCDRIDYLHFLQDPLSDPQPNLIKNFTSFADWCLHKDRLGKAAKHTVEVLLKISNTFNCQAASEILSNLTSLNLRSKEIIDIRPLSCLINLTKLDLRNNKIKDLSSLSSLTNLTELNLFQNQITDLSSLSSLINLTKLHLHNNQIIDISPLSSLTNLKLLNLAGNKIIDISPLSSLTNLKWNKLLDMWLAEEMLH